METNIIHVLHHLEKWRGYLNGKEISGSDNLKCHLCGIMFATQQEKQQHMKLEHQNKEEPTGVG